MNCSPRLEMCKPRLAVRYESSDLGGRPGTAGGKRRSVARSGRGSPSGVLSPEWLDQQRPFPRAGDTTPRTQKVILAVGRLRAAVLRRTRRDRNAVTNGDGIFCHQNVLNQKPYDSLALSDAQRFRGTAQASQECCEGLCETQECSLIVGLVGDRLELSTGCLLALT